MISMEFITAPKISQVKAIKALGLDPPEVAQVLCEVFSKMVFCYGFVHCDPHAGNIFVRRNPDSSIKRQAQLVLLDHGLYRELDSEFRKTYCDLWRAMLMRDNVLLENCGRRLNIGEVVRYLPLLFTYRTINHKGRLDASMSEQERQKLSEDLKNLRFSNVTEFLEQLPRDMLFVLRTNNMIRALNKDLGGTKRERFSIMGNSAIRGNSAFFSDSSERTCFGVLVLVGLWWQYANLHLRLRLADYLMTAMHYIRRESAPKFKRTG